MIGLFCRKERKDRKGCKVWKEVIKDECSQISIGKIVEEIAYGVARPPRPCCKGDGALATSGFATRSVQKSQMAICHACARRHDGGGDRDGRPERPVGFPLRTREVAGGSGVAGVRGERQDDRARLLERLLALLQPARHRLLPAHVRARRGGGRRVPRGGRRGPPLALLGGRTRDRLQQAAVEQVRVPHRSARGRTPRARGRRRLRGGQQEGEALLGLLRLLPLRRLPPRREARRAGEARGAAPRGGAHA